MSETNAKYGGPIDSANEHLQFRDLATAVIKAWEHAGYEWCDLVDGFGGGDGTGLPSLDLFEELSVDMIAHKTAGLQVAELRRLMRSRLYRRNFDFDRHYDFTHGNEYFTNRSDLLAYAVWQYLYNEMERQYFETDTEDEEDVEPEQLALPL